MALHLIHVSKSGGSTLRYAIREARKANGGELDSPWGPIWGHNHLFTMSDLEEGDMAVFALRDPITRFVSGFYSRLREGAPRYHIRHTRAERRAFEWFPTPQELADALAEKRGKERRRATIAMESIGHVKRRMTFWTGTPDSLRRNLDRVLYIARQETLSEDWEKLKDLLDLPREVMLSGDDTIAHRTEYVGDRTIGKKGTRALRKWYAEDYELLAIADQVRAGTTQPTPAKLSRMAALRDSWDRRRSAATG
jgi:Sulfotransferase family